MASCLTSFGIQTYPEMTHGSSKIFDLTRPLGPEMIGLRVPKHGASQSHPMVTNLFNPRDQPRFGHHSHPWKLKMAILPTDFVLTSLLINIYLYTYIHIYYVYRLYTYTIPIYTF